MDLSFDKLLARMHELKDLASLIGLGSWDQETYLPPKANTARGQQLSTLQALYHERLVDSELGDLLQKVQEDSSLDSDAHAMVRVLTWERNRAIRVPERLVRALVEAQTQALTAWRAARPAKDFSLFRPALERLLTLRLEQADAMGHSGERYDALLEGHEPGMTVARLRPVLSRLKERLVSLVDKIKGAAGNGSSDVLQGRDFDVERQWQFGLGLLRDMGFDLEAGRQDRSLHPFTNGVHPTDVRLTTRLDPRNPLSGLFSTLHEGGHGLFEQGFLEAHYRTPLAASPSMGLHESQSRLWENLVGRSRPFWRHYFPLLQKAFPEQLSDVSNDLFYQIVNRVSPSLIRVDSDEMTYNLHIVLRFELELMLVRGELPVAELPSAWNAQSAALLGVQPSHDGEGVLQDIHWAWGEFGYFPTYALGNLYAASLYAAAKAQIRGLEDQIGRGELLPLRNWLRKNVHSEGFRESAEERVRKATGTGLSDEAFIAYLKHKYGELYQLSL